MTDGARAIISGRGVLPKMLAEASAGEGRPYHVVTFAGVPLDWIGNHPVIEAQFEKLGALFDAMTARGVTEVVFAGGMNRPNLNPLRFDATFAKLSVRLLPALKNGDDATLRVITGAFEAAGFKMRAPHEVLSDLRAPAGVLSQAQPDAADQSDAARAAKIVAALGGLDVGQGAVVAQGICLATETIQGTDVMIAHSISGRARLPDAKGAKGVVLKAPKPGQDWRVDLPAIGPDTVRAAAQAGLGGVVVEADGVLILAREETIAEADATGLFLWSRPRDA